MPWVVLSTDFDIATVLLDCQVFACKLGGVSVQTSPRGIWTLISLDWQGGALPRLPPTCLTCAHIALLEVLDTGVLEHGRKGHWHSLWLARTENCLRLLRLRVQRPLASPVLLLYLAH